MKYFEVELKNPDEFLKQQTEDFMKANRWLLIKEDEAYYLITQYDYSWREMVEKFRSVFEKKVSLDKLETLTETDFLKKFEKSYRGDLIKFLLNSRNDTQYSMMKPNAEKLEELNTIIGLTKTENGVASIVSSKNRYAKSLDCDIDELSVSEVIDIITANPRILKSPILIDEKRLQVGYKEDDIRAFLPRAVRNVENAQARMRAAL